MTGPFDDDDFDNFSVPAWPQKQQRQQQQEEEEEEQQQLSVRLNSSFVLPPPEDDSMWNTAEVDALEIDNEFGNRNKNTRKNNNLLSSSSNELFVTKTASIAPRMVKPRLGKAATTTIDKFHKSFGDFPDMISFESPTTTTATDDDDDDAGAAFHKSFTIGTMPLSEGGMKEKQSMGTTTKCRRKRLTVNTHDENAEDINDGSNYTDESRGRRSRSRSRGRDKATATRSQSRTRERSESRGPKKKSSSSPKKQRDRSRDRRTVDAEDDFEKPKRKGRRSRSRGPLADGTKKDVKLSTTDSDTNDTSDKKRRSRSSRRSRSPGPLTKDDEKSSGRSKSPGALKKNRDKSSRRSKSPGPIAKDRDRSSRRSKSPGPLKKDRERSSRRERSLGPVTKDRDRSSRRERSLGPITKGHERSSRRERSLGPVTKDRERSSSPRSQREISQNDPSVSLLSPQKRNKSRKDSGSRTLQRSKSIADPSMCFHASFDDLEAFGIDLAELTDGGGNADQTTLSGAKAPLSRARNLSRTKSMNENVIRSKNRALSSGLQYVDHNNLCRKRTAGRRDGKSYGSGSRSSESSSRSSNMDGKQSSNYNEPRQLHRRKSHLDTKLGRVDQKSGFIHQQGNGGEERSIFSSDSSGSRRRRDKKGDVSMRTRRTSFEDGSMNSSHADDHLKAAREMRKAEEARLKRLKEESKLLEEKRRTEETRLKALQEESRILELRSIEQKMQLPPAFQAIVDCLDSHKS